jgi:hypothetical protein
MSAEYEIRNGRGEPVARMAIVYSGPCYGRPHSIVEECGNEVMVYRPDCGVVKVPRCDIEVLETSRGGT